MEKLCGIYKVTNPNGLVYIGQSLNCNRRIVTYKRLECKPQRKLYESLREFGSDNHSFEVIQHCLPEELNGFEEFYIIKYNANNHQFGLNLTAGGNSNMPCEETRIKIGKAHLGNKHSLGKKHSNQGRINHSLAVSGERHPQFGKKITDTAKEKMRQKTKGIPKSEFAKQKIKENHFARPVNQYYLDGVFIKQWQHAKAARSTGNEDKAIHNNCRGYQKSAFGFIWKYANLSDEERQQIGVQAENLRQLRNAKRRKRQGFRYCTKLF